jgi:hypothetical protein
MPITSISRRGASVDRASVPGVFRLIRGRAYRLGWGAITTHAATARDHVLNGQKFIELADDNEQWLA